MKTIADVILPLSIYKPLSYLVPPEHEGNSLLGQRVVVPLKNKLYTGIVQGVKQINTEDAHKLKWIEHIYQEPAAILPQTLNLWKWISDYYACAIGDVLSIALPQALKISSESHCSVSHTPNLDLVALSDKEKNILQCIEVNPNITIQQVSELLDIKNVLPSIQKLFQEGLLEVKETFQENYKEKRQAWVMLKKELSDEQWHELFKKLEKRSPKQSNLLLKFLSLQQSKNLPIIEKTLLLQDFAGAEGSLKALIKKEILEISYQKTSRLFHAHKTRQEPFVLNQAQNQAVYEIEQAFKEQKIALLHGITSSGKTEIYIHWIQKILDQGLQVLFLVPEIALSTQMWERVGRYFGPKVMMYHSRLNDQERAEVWLKQASKEPYQIILGTRSATLLPFQNLGLVIVDEEHESSYKQQSPAPRYHARDTAIMLAHQNQASVILGSATPSIESYFNALHGKYALIALHQKYFDSTPPVISLIDLKEMSKKKRMKSHFSEDLLSQIGNTLEEKQKVILFQNRRGFALYMQCESCDYTEMCHQCDVSLTYYKKENILICHYCGSQRKVEPACRDCGSFTLKIRGFGTEKIEDELSVFFPNHTIARLDLDSTRKKNSFQKILSAFDQGQIDILVGTQMITKGLDFKNVGLVGILNADNLLYFPDFRTQERAFQLMIQVAGRAGRNTQNAKVLIQTYQPKHPLFTYVLEHNYLDMYKREIQERQAFLYPPYARLLKITCKAKQQAHLEKSMTTLAQRLKELNIGDVLGPQYPLVKWVKTNYIQEILIKQPKSANYAKHKEQIHLLIETFFQDSTHKGIKYYLDVDPQ